MVVFPRGVIVFMKWLVVVHAQREVMDFLEWKDYT
jgi:hypothetical protein